MNDGFLCSADEGTFGKLKDSVVSNEKAVLSENVDATVL